MSQEYIYHECGDIPEHAEIILDGIKWSLVIAGDEEYHRVDIKSCPFCGTRLKLHWITPEINVRQKNPLVGVNGGYLIPPEFREQGRLIRI